jgi:hypothetical protein
MQQGEHLYVISVGDTADWQVGRGGLYYTLDDNGEKGVPVFSELQRAERYVEANIVDPDAHLGHRLGGAAADYVRALAEGRFALKRLEAEQVAQAAASVGADYLIRDARPGQQQEIVRLD